VSLYPHSGQGNAEGRTREVCTPASFPPSLHRPPRRLSLPLPLEKGHYVIESGVSQDGTRMFGDYEAQRHWMELTLSLPARDWYAFFGEFIDFKTSMITD